MKTILLQRHAATEVEDSSLYTVFSQIEDILENDYHLLKPEGEPFSMRDLETWTLENALDADLAIVSYMKHVEVLRKNGWKGKVIYQALGGFPRGGAKFREVMPYLYQSDLVWFTSSADAGIYYEFVAQDGTQPEAVHLPFGVKNETYYPLNDKEKHQSLRETWGFNSNDFVLVYTGRVTVEKNVQTTLGAVAELIRLGYPVKLVMVCRFEDVPFTEFGMHPIDLEGKINTLIDTLGISENVTILGWQSAEELNEVFNASDAFINLTLHHDENFGLSQIEAMSAAVPVVGTAWGGLKDTIENFEGGFRINTWVSENGIRVDTPAVIDAVKRLIENKALREEQGRLGQQRSLKKFSYADYIVGVKQLVERALNSPTNETKATLSAFGSRYSQRFTWRTPELKYAKRGAMRPTYDGLSDPDYRQLITPYTSGVASKLNPDSLLFLGLNGKQNGSFFISEDPLYPIRLPTCSEEAAIINQLSFWHAVPRSTLNHSDDILTKMVERGLVGISTEIPEVP